ncbi:MAG TPA: recombinase family protein [Planctomycetota bacterium]|nr:recombinase family protein [Planctomycetota bacterium]
MKVVGYVRVSTTEQAEDGASLAAQEEGIRRYCDLHGYELVRVERDEGVSAKSLDRPGWRRVERWLRRGRGVVVTKLDRASRCLEDVIGLVKDGAARGWYLHSVQERLDTSTAMGEFFVHMLAAIAQLERKRTGERVRETMAALRRRGAKLSSARPYGWRIDGKVLVEDAEEQRVRGLILSMAERGPTAIASELNAMGERRESGAWTKQAVSRVLRRARLLSGRVAS